MMPEVVTLVLADHHALLAEGLGLILDAEDDLVVLDMVYDAGRAVQSVSRHRPAVLLMDAHLPGGDLIDTVAAVRAASPMTKLLVLSGDGRPKTTAAVITSGVDGFLTKDRSSRQVAAGIRHLAGSEQAVMMAAQLRPPGRDPMVELRLRSLSCREREILSRLTIGWSNRRIAADLDLTYLTVRSHVQNLLVKLGVHSRLEAAAFAVTHGVVAAGGAPAWERSSA
jgi:two-component system nitrate/nitrite response regulator NarL